MKRAIRIIGVGLIISVATTIDANDDKNFAVCSSDNFSSLKLNGFLKLEQRIFINNKELRNGSYIKAAYLNISGEPFPDLSFNLGLDFDAIESKVKVSDAYITYSGYKGLRINTGVNFF